MLGFCFDLWFWSYGMLWARLVGLVVVVCLRVDFDWLVF